MYLYIVGVIVFENGILLCCELLLSIFKFCNAFEQQNYIFYAVFLFCLVFLVLFKVNAFLLQPKLEISNLKNPPAIRLPLNPWEAHFHKI